MERSLKKILMKDLGRKILLVSGPRQVGKTTLSKNLSKAFEYLNYDRKSDRFQLLKEEFNREAEVIIFDEIHKMKNWKKWLKGIVDTEGQLPIVVTGSARMDAFKKMGDSLAGRYFQFQLFPFDVKEICQNSEQSAEEVMNRLLKTSGFPEPFLSDEKGFYIRWKQTHQDIILRQDILELGNIRRIQDLELLVDLMGERIGSPLSVNSLREDLQTDDKTIRRWLNILEMSYVLFKIPPYSQRLKNSIHKSSKYYFFDIVRARDPGARFENLVALSLLKEITFRRDSQGEDFSLFYVRSKTKKEIDFLICKEKKPHLLVECKLSDNVISDSFLHFTDQLKEKVKCIQVVKDLERNFSNKAGVKVVKAFEWLKDMNIS